MKEINCVVCGESATFLHPKPFCDNHWIDYFVENDPDDSILLTPEQQEVYREELKQIIAENKNEIEDL